VDIALTFPVQELADGFSGYNSEPDHLLLVVRRDSGIQSPADLAGKRVIMMERDKLSDIYLETLLLQAWGKADWKRLAPPAREQRSSQLAHRLFFNQADAALIYRNGYDAALALNPQIERQLRVLEDYSLKIRSPHIGLFSAQVRPEHRSFISEAAMRLNGTARGRQVMQIYKAEGMVPTRVGDLAPFERLLEAHRALKQPSPAPAKKAKQ
jgi:ABC-type phosphate/phosphonate transport system substrate-binding protein